MIKRKCQMFLPTKMKWTTIHGLYATTYSGKDILIATHKHGIYDWEISFGRMLPISNYTDFVIESVSGKEISKDSILAVWIIPSYGYLLEDILDEPNSG
jgi:hypothetical protein